MASVATALNRLEKQGQGDHIDTWGSAHLNPTLDAIDACLDGQVRIDTDAAASPYNLTVNDYAADEARQRVIVLTGSATAFRVNVHFGLPHWYLVSNQTQAAVTVGFDNDAATAVVPPGVWVLLVENGSALRVSQPGLDIDPVVNVTTPTLVLANTHANKILVCQNDCAVTVGTFGAAPAGAWLLLRSVFAAVDLTIDDPWAGTRAVHLPYQQFVRLGVVAPGLVTLLEWGTQVTT